MELLQKFNQKEHTIPEIWDVVDKRCPMVVRAYDQGEDVAVLVTQVCKDIPYGYPLYKGRRQFCDWYRKEFVGSVRIPEGTSPIWSLVDLPYDNLDGILHLLYPNEPLTEPAYKPQPSPAKNAAEAPAKPEKKESAKTATTKTAAGNKANETARDDGSVIIPFGRYKGKTINAVRKSNAAYIEWAMKNIPAFKELIEVTA